MVLINSGGAAGKRQRRQPEIADRPQGSDEADDGTKFTKK